MALIRCPECGTSVSDRAAACPKCACPIAAPQRARAQRSASGHVTVERTSKSIKGEGCLASVLIVLSVFMVFFGISKGFVPLIVLGVACFLGGMLWRFVLGAATWWHHG